MDYESRGNDKYTPPTPGEDFFRHVNGEWLENTEMPAGEPRYGTYDMIGHRTTKRLRTISENLQRNDELVKGSVEQQVRDFYQSGVNMEARNELGLDPLAEQLQVIRCIANRDDVVRTIAFLRSKGTATFFSSSYAEDDKMAGTNALYIGQSGLSLPNRNYYFKDDEASKDVRENHKKFKTILFQMLDRTPDEAEQAAEAVQRIEYTLAEASLPAAEARIADKNYFKFTPEQANDEFAGIDWNIYFDTLGKPDIKDFVIQQPKFIKKVGEILQNTDINDIKYYLEFTLVNSCAGSLSQEIYDVNFAFKGQVLSGLKVPQPLWKQIVGRFNGIALKNAVGPLYCQEYFDQESKVKLEQMVSDVKDTFRDRVLQLDWMSSETKELTLQKLDNISFKMGYPEQWPDVSDIDIQPNAFLQNLMNMAESSNKKRLAQLDEPFDLSEWEMPPTMVNACSDLKREMTFPAAVLQAPFFDPNQDDAYNYGAIGATFGHELTHFFDDEGCKYDLDGNLNEWWNEQDKTNFENKTQAFAEYFGSLKANGLQVDGQLTMGENIADVGGIKIAYGAYKRKLAREGVREIVDGMTPEQRFFTGWARKWAGKVTLEYAKRSNLTDPHSPAEIRVNGVLAITPEFHEAFGIKAGDNMYVSPDDQPKLW